MATKKTSVEGNGHNEILQCLKKARDLLLESSHQAGTDWSAARRLMNLAERADGLHGDVAALAGGPQNHANPNGSPELACDQEVSAKERGRRNRDDFVGTLSSKGCSLAPLKGAIFRSPRGLRVGVAFSREGKPDKWFLGLPEDGFEHAVLLCEERSGRIIHFSLPKEFLEEHGNALSRRDGQVKFNVSRRREAFFLQVPRRGLVTIEPFRDNFSGLI
jgi:hypothetical protein